MGFLKNLLGRIIGRKPKPVKKHRERLEELEEKRLSRVESIQELRRETHEETYHASLKRHAKTEVKNFGKTKGYQLMFIASFEHADTGIQRGPFTCFSSFHKRKTMDSMFEEAVMHGQSQAQGDYDYAAVDEEWVIYDVHRMRILKYNP